MRRSVNSWTNRIYRMLRKRCEYIFLNKLHDVKVLKILYQMNPKIGS